ncbi:uncharacterized protein METZ01_LOCUS448323, partial [marine metagenome]
LNDLGDGTYVCYVPVQQVVQDSHTLLYMLLEGCWC